MRFQKNEVAKGAAVEKEKDKLKGQGQTTIATATTTTPIQYSNGCATDAAVSSTVATVATPVPVPANFESSALISNVNAVNRIDDEGTNEEANEEEDVKEPRDAITLSLVE